MPKELEKLINAITYLPGIGEKSATKLAFFLLNSNQNFNENLSESIKNIKTKVSFCKNCFSLCDLGQDFCNICKDEDRDKQTIAVVEEYLDMMMIEESGIFKGNYHILGGAISPINGVFIGDLRFKELFERIQNADGKVEIILATNPNIEGEATSSYIIEEIEKRKLKYKTKITKLSRGLSSGYLEYADNITLVNALKERKEV
ncbi:recombination protein RecR [Candidatus Gracilibacteria bacterium HOT-871]|nr:recombination protein RecR [Candidatus Gracilibacteria bacterium HOT-871]